MEESQMIERRYAGFWLRFAAYLIDLLIVSIPSAVVFFGIIIVSVAVIGGSGSEDFTPQQDFAFALCFAVAAVVSAFVFSLYFAIFHSSKWQATLGKRALGLKIIGSDGGRISFWRALGRALAMSLSAVFYIGYLLAAFTEKKQALHDMIAGTYVIIND
ncbi:hypothetical protein BpJC4_25970 [Weizmannia acidilactici]|uniref:RDD family protein n=1 Tax=Weizmannia acidilactici TaxID=2607726 RepID=UPI00124EE40E|nr:RDD family protein [Weizmannia acidilactici]GER68126.1 hypothetical protein BpJC4_25970 [Weizmannia acidilactici]